jgi:uncharacterized protein VirK/YbjX
MADGDAETPDRPKKLKRKFFDKELARLQREVVLLQEYTKAEA